ncbi:pilus assembly protein PilM [Candidatus Saccharibacteria bacterium 32-50-10]|nr:MAG: pilus assembly protein PilM [Candidatus Saccharibacteria bacterium 32-50-10]
MKLSKGLGDFFGLDIGTNAVRVVQLSRSGESWNLVHYGYAPVDSRITASDSAESRRRLGEVIMTAIGQSGIKATNVAIGLPSSKTFTTIVDVPKVSEQELKATMKYQVDQYIPMAIDEAKVDWALLGDSLKSQGQYEVLLSSTAKSYAEERLELVEGLGLNVIAEEPDQIAMVRSLMPANAQEARLILDMGENSTDLAVVYGGAPRLVRTVPTGLSSMVRAAVQNLNVQDSQARQFILKFGLAPDRLDGQVLRAIDGVLDNFTAELIKSVKFFQTRYPSIPVSGISFSGFGAAIPQIDAYVSSKTGIPSVVADPWQRVNLTPADKQQLMPVASEFAAVVGLAQRRNQS